MKLATLILSGSVELNPDGTNCISDLSRIYQVARGLNLEYDLTGIISYLKGRFFLIVEGDQDVLFSLQKDYKFFKIYKNIKVVFFAKATNHFFPQSNLAVNHNIRECPYLRKFCQIYFNNLVSLEEKRKSLFQQISPVDLNQSSSSFEDLNTEENFMIKSGTQQSEPAVSSENVISSVSKPVEQSSGGKFDDKILRLMAWPDFTRVDSSPGTIELCAKLLATSKSYHELVMETKFGTETDISYLLNLFEEMCILDVTDSPIATAAIEKKPTKKTKVSFYNKMKNFITKNK